MKLSALAIDRAKPGSKRREIGDPGCEGLKLIVQPSGAKSWAFRFRLHGDPHKLTIGPYPDIGLADAREKAAEARKQVRSGIDPTAEQSGARASAAAARHTTVEIVAERYLTEHAERKTRPASARASRLVLTRDIAPWKGRPLRDIQRADIKEAIAAAEKRGPSSAIKSRMVLSRFFSWAVEQEILDVSPVRGLPKIETPEEGDRALSDAEVVRFWHATDKVEPWLKVYLRVLLLTSRRRTELAGLPWSEINGELWTLPKERSKNKRTHILPLTPTVMEELGSLTRIGDTFAFTSDGVTHRQNYDKMKKQIDAAIAADGAGEMQPWRFHDLRRTAGTGMARLGVAPHIVEHTLNHTQAKLVRTYQTYDYLQEKATALSRWEQHILALLDGRQGANVVLFGKVS